MGRFSGTQPSSVGFCGDYSSDSSDHEIQWLIEQDQTQLAQSREEQAQLGQTREEQAQLPHLIHQDQAQLGNQNTVYPPQPESEFGFPQICYCGSVPRIGTCYNRTDPGRRFFTCPNVDDGEMHVCKWWDDAVMEEMRNADRHIGQLAEKVDALHFFSDNDTDQKLLSLENRVLDTDQRLVSLENMVVETSQQFGRLEKRMCELAKNKSRSTFDVFVAVMVMVLVVIGILLIVV